MLRFPQSAGCSQVQTKHTRDLVGLVSVWFRLISLVASSVSAASSVDFLMSDEDDSSFLSLPSAVFSPRPSLSAERTQANVPNQQLLIQVTGSPHVSGLWVTNRSFAASCIASCVFRNDAVISVRTETVNAQSVVKRLVISLIPGLDAVARVSFPSFTCACFWTVASYSCHL